ncbi:acyltransferase [Sphingobium sp. WCS2017Hpa-17]|uniref:acyltransferase family protein n=1 Tax=Sphingobium sp. WCS2017Hpa-17 TaxID=3073638 RepID=UPI0028898853|nr:acyltransferase [Sphingobium sp. WCS2017Hpa-17]
MAPDTPICNRSLSIHYLRAVAALMVVAYHIFSYRLVRVPADDPRYFLWLQFGVAIFFMISGYVMVSSTQGRAVTPLGFLARRVKRIAPLYWMVTLFSLLSLGGVDAGRLIASLCFLPWIDPATGRIGLPVLDVGWTLNYEMAFYVLFALSLHLPRNVAIWSVIALLALLSSLVPLAGTHGMTLFLFQPFLLDFAAGMMIAHMRIRAPRWLLPVGFLLLATLHAGIGARLLAVTLPAGLIIASALAWDDVLQQWRWPMLLGDASYAIYLTHIFVILAIQAMGGPIFPPVLMLGGTIMTCALVGILAHLILERRLFRWVTAWLRRTASWNGAMPAPPQRRRSVIGSGKRATALRQ